MAGFSPPSRTMGRQLPAIPTSPPASLSHNNVGLPTGPHSIGLPAPSEYGRQMSTSSIGGRQESHQVGRQESNGNLHLGRQESNGNLHGGRQESQPNYVRQDSDSRHHPYNQSINQSRKPEQSYRQLPPEPPYNHQANAYNQPRQEPSYNQPRQPDPSYNRPRVVDPSRHPPPDPSYNNQSRQLPPDPSYNPSSYNPHVNHNRASVSSLASVPSWPGSQASSYHGSPRGSYSAGSPRASYAALPQTSSVSSYSALPQSSANYENQRGSYAASNSPSYAASNASSPRTSFAPPPPQFNGSSRIPESYQSTPGPPLSREPSVYQSSGSPSHYQAASGSRPPPPYRAPPPEPLPYRQPPQPPADHGLPPAPPRQFSTPEYPPSQDVSPPPPPKRSSPNPSEPPPLPRRPPPLSESKKPPPPSLKTSPPLPLTTKEPSPPSPLQHSPTDSGFQTAPEDRHSDSPQPKMSISLSKSYGNLHTGEDKENRLSSMSSRLNSVSLDQLDNEDNVISVKERTKTFNRMASETDVTATHGSTKSINIRSVKRRNSRAVEHIGSRRGSCRDDESHDSSSITTIDPTVKSWMVHTAKGDYQTAAKMLNEEPKLARHKDFTSGYTGLHWAAKHNNTDMVKLLAGTYQANVNARSHGGYTPLHIAAQSGNQEVFDLLIQAYRADANLRDYSGKKPRQYLIVQETGALGMSLSLSSDTFRQLKDGGKTRVSRGEKNTGLLKFGSLSVKVKKTTEAFNNYFNGESSKKGGGSNDTSPFKEDSAIMPPPKFAPIKKRKSKRTVDFGRTKSAPVTPVERSPVKEVIPEIREDDGSIDSDSEYGFGNTWAGETPA